MAWTSAVLATGESAGYNGDKPLLQSLNAVDNVDAGTNGLSWKQGGSWAAGADETAATFDGLYANDLDAAYPTKPATAQLVWYFILRSTAGFPAFDLAALLGCNTKTLPADLVVTLQIADDDAYAVNLQTIATWNPNQSSKRLTSMILKHTGAVPLRYSGVTRARLKFQSATPFTPEIGELILGRRRQMLHQPDQPWGPEDFVSQWSDFRSVSGKTARTVDWKGAAAFEPSWEVQDANELADVQALISSDSQWATRPILVVPFPLSAPGRAYWMRIVDQRVRFPNHFGASARSLHLALEEDAPFYAPE